MFFGIFVGRVSIVSVFLFANFLRFRYFFSPNTKQAFAQMRTTLDSYVEKNAKVPLGVRKVYKIVRDNIVRFADVEGAAPAPAGGDGNRQ